MKLSAPLCYALFALVCVTARSNVTLQVPRGAANRAEKGTIAVGPVHDMRVFLNKATELSVPSIDGDADKAPKERLERVVGRRRNSYGDLLEDIVLDQGDSVAKRMQALLEEGFRRRGYTIATGPGAETTATATISEFWGWYKPGTWASAFEVNLACKVTVTRGNVAKAFFVTGHCARDERGSGEVSWESAYKWAFEDFLTNLDAELARAGL